MFDWIKRFVFRVPKEKLISWPTPETDYEGNQMWEKAFPQKTRELTINEQRYYAAMAQAGLAAQYYGQVCSNPFGMSGLPIDPAYSFSGLIGWR